MNENKTNINWLRTIQSRSTPKPYKISEKQKINHTCFIIKYIKIDKK